MGKPAAEIKAVVVRPFEVGSAAQLSFERGLPSSEATTIDAMSNRPSNIPVKSSGSMLS